MQPVPAHCSHWKSDSTSCLKCSATMWLRSDAGLNQGGICRGGIFCYQGGSGGFYDIRGGVFRRREVPLPCVMLSPGLGFTV